MMRLFNIFTNRSRTDNSKSDTSKEFTNTDCRCVQQELDLSELIWMDTSTYIRSKQELRRSSIIAIRMRLASNKQSDLFEGV